MDSGDGRPPESLIASAYGAAVAVCANPKVAERVSSVALDAHTDSERELILRTLRLGVRTVPGEAFRGMTVDQREAVALARPGGATVDEIAAALDISPSEAKRRMLEGLRAAAAEPAPQAR
jgi:DNA-directed RNA polymerase specialized sigma24 family protein